MISCNYIYIVFIAYSLAINLCSCQIDLDKRSEEILDNLILGPGCSSGSCEIGKYKNIEYEGYDGWYNNLARPSQGAVDTPLLRILGPVYKDGVYQPVERNTNPFAASSRLMKGSSGTSSVGGITAFLVYFGQQVVEEIVDSQRAACPPEYILTEIPPTHEYSTEIPSGLKSFPTLRTRFDMTTGFSPNNPRQQLNEITPYIDGTIVYGAAKGWADVLRTFRNNTPTPFGQLAWHSKLGEGFPEENEHRMPFANPPPPTKHSEHIANGFTEDVDRFFKLGNVRGNENPFLLTFGVFWFRWHNTIAKYLHKRDPSLDGEKLFNEARKWVIATQQAIILYDWLPRYMRENTKTYEGYKPTVDPQISQAFQTTAMRYGHTLVTSGGYLRSTEADGCTTKEYKFLRSGTHSAKGVRTCNAFWRSTEVFNDDRNNFEQFILGLSSQPAEREDNIIVDDIRNRLFGPLEFNRRDLMVLNILRARDHGLPDYNSARKAFGLKFLDDFDELKKGLSVSDDIIEAAKDLYGHPNNTDIWVGGLLEADNGPGELFKAIIKDQFERIRDGDRFWFENEHNGLFTKDQIERLKNFKISGIIRSIANLTVGIDMQEDPFTAPRANDNWLNGTRCVGMLSHNISCTVFGAKNSTSCLFLPPLDARNLEQCEETKTYDYFTGSSISFILTFLSVGIVGIATLVGVKSWSFVRIRRKQNIESSVIKATTTSFKCKEKMSTFENRIIVVQLESRNRRILVSDKFGKILRAIDLSFLDGIVVKHTEDNTRLVIRADNHYDLYLVFNNSFDGTKLMDALSKFCDTIHVTVHDRTERRAELQHKLITVKEREEHLAKFVRFVLSQAFKENISSSHVFEKKEEFMNLQLTKSELASALGMNLDSIFVQQLFTLMDVDRSGFISVNEFFNLMLIFSKGTLEEKAALFFNIYDLDQSGLLSANDFTKLVESSLGSEIKKDDISKMVNTMLESVGLGPGQSMNFEQFYQVFQEQAAIMNYIGIDMEQESTRKDSRFSIYGSHPKGNITKVPDRETEKEHKEFAIKEDDSQWAQKYRQLSSFFLSKQKIIFWWSLYTVVMLLIFAERAYYFSVEREHAGLRRIAGYGVTVTRGAASSMMFTYSTLLLTMARNLLSFLRSTPLHVYFPFDDMIELHKYIGWWAFFWTIVHIIGHSINFYHISTQTPADLACIFRDFYRSTHVIPKFHYWCWETVTGLTGVFLTVQVFVIYVFAYYARRHLFKFFWLTHNTYPLFYLLMILHGSGNLVQPPFFHYFFLAPVIIFTLDKLVSVSRNSIQIDVIKAVHLPSNVTLLCIRRPENFSFLSGQWVRIASLGISKLEFHPFTISSSPQEKFITLHIRGVGPWTNQLRKIYPDFHSIMKDKSFRYPKVFIDGPFGEGHQTWWNYEIVIFVGGGIGVTPFSSILKDIVGKSAQPASRFKCKRVLFLWVTRSQRQFEWLTDILRQVENNDRLDIIRIHIFITQFKSKYDLRTIMLYMAERHFQRVCGTSLFTGLKAITHFSRPNFPNVFQSIKEQYKEASLIGVFTCGNPSLSTSVEAGCREANKLEGPVLKHYYENF